jgi:dCTP deaminase
MILSDATLRTRLKDGTIAVSPWPEDIALQPASIDLRLGRQMLHNTVAGTITVDLTDTWVFTLDPGDTALACTLEQVTVPDDLVARVEGKSSWGRRFLTVHATAGFIDPGFCGQITLELANLSREPVQIPTDAYVAQISFHQLDQPALRPYGESGLGSRYQFQRGPTPSRLFGE